MLLIRFIVVVSILGIASCSSFEQQNIPTVKISADELILDAQQGLAYFEKKPFTGIATSYYAKNQQKAEIEYKEGKKHGNSKQWFRNGTLSYHAIYQNGKLNGETHTWWKNTNRRTTYNYTNGVANGIQWQWYQSGAKFKKLYLKNGREEGMQQSWRENGKLYNNYEAKNGRIFGLKRSKLCFTLDDETVVY